MLYTLDKTQIKQYALSLLNIPEADLFSSATSLREASFKKHIEMCAIINTRSGHCPMDCKFCSQSMHYNTKAPTFTLLNKKQILERLDILSTYPIQRVGLVTSGSALQDEQVKDLTDIIKELPMHWHGRICASLGKLNNALLKQLKDVGLNRYHHNLETSSNYYAQVCSTQTWDERLNTVNRAKQQSLQVCVGGLFGLGESWEDRIDFAISLREHNINHIPINFLHPHEGTPLAKQKPLEATEALRIIAIFRHILPNATLRICGGRPLVLAQRQHEIFAAGANALMTGNYLTTQGQDISNDCNMIIQQGLEIQTC